MRPIEPLGQPIAAGRTAEIYAWDNREVLKLHFDWVPPHLVEQEARITHAVTRAIAGTGVRAPRAGEIVEVNGRRGLVYERVDGPSMSARALRRLYLLVSYAHLLADLHLEIHRIAAPVELPSQREHQMHSIRGMRSIHAAQALPEDLKTAVLNLYEDLPAGDRLCHNDFHPENVLMAAAGPVIIDWESASRGHPCADAARTSMTLTMAKASGLGELVKELFRRSYVRHYLRGYRALVPASPPRFNDWLTVQAAYRLSGDFPGEREKLVEIIRAGLGEKKKATTDKRR